MDSGGNSVAESVGESPEPEQAARLAGKVNKGRGLRRWRRIPREHHREGSPASPVSAGAVAGAPGEDLAQLHKRRHALDGDAPKGKHDAAAEEESSVASVESSFVPLEASTPPAPTRLDPNLGHLIATAGFSVGTGGADSENSDDRSSTAASAPRTAHPRHEFSFGGFGRERERARSRAPGSAAHSKNLRSARVRGPSARAAASPASPVEPENSRSSVESNLRGSSTAQPRESVASISSNGVHKVLFPDDHHSDEEPPSEELRYTNGSFYKQNGSVVGRLVMGNCDSDANDGVFDEASVGKFENGGTHTGLDPYVESIALLQSAQEALENEIQKFVEVRKETDESSTTHDNGTEWINSFQTDETVESLSEKLQALELKLEEATVLIKEKDSKILELDALNQMQAREACRSNLLSLQSEIEQLLLDKMEAEIQCFILTRASQAWRSMTNDQVASNEMQKSPRGDHKSIETKLRHAENRVMMLEEMVDKLEAQCKELSEGSEVLKLKARASKTSLFCSLQLVLLFIAMWTLLVRFLPSSTEFVPT